MANDFGGIEDYEELAFEEESASLEAIEGQIDELIKPLREEVDSLSEWLRDFRAFDYDDVDQKRIAMKDRERAKEREAELRERKPEPYFCHFEASVDDGEVKSFFIGEKAIGNLASQIVLDWRSPLGRSYRNKNQRQFTTNVGNGKYVHTYDLRLRRMVQIKDAILQSVNTEFDTADMSLDGEIVDPFLLSVLKDKRRNYKLSDIIKTIQQNQNEILELPIDESFIVQGCAGSGKTMILLHRLSYLAFNYPKTDFSKFVVLTPSQSFNDHIDELCEQLELGRISRMTVESYYVRLGKLLSRNDTYETQASSGSRKMIPKVNFENVQVAPELLLPHDYLAEAYSTGFAERLCGEIANCVGLVVEELRDQGVEEMLTAKGENIDFESLPYQLFSDLRKSCKRIRSAAEGSLATVTEKENALNETAAELEKVSGSYNSAVALLRPVAEAVRSRAIPSYQRNSAALDEKRRELVNAKSRLKTAERKRDDAQHLRDSSESEFARLRAEIDEARSILEEEADIEGIKGKEDVRERAFEVSLREAEKLASLQDELANAGVFGIGKKRKLRENIKAAELAYQEAFDEALLGAANDYIQEQRERGQERIAELESLACAAEEECSVRRNELQECQEHCSKLGLLIGQLQDSVTNLKAPIDALKACVDAFATDGYPDGSKMPSAEEVRVWSEEIAAYVDTFNGLTVNQRRYLYRGEGRIRILSEKLETAKDELAAAKAAAVTDADLRTLDKADALIGELDARVLEESFYGMVNALRKKHGVRSATTGIYRHELYLRLLFCHQYYGSIDGSGVCLSIDEAQDLSVAEYALLRGILGPAAVLNLYGDTGQMIYRHRGISSWADLASTVSSNLYTLGENYRNTRQITAYCNEKLEMDIIAVGLDDEDVHEDALRDAVESLFALRSSREGIRCAIVYKRGLHGAKALLERYLGRDAAFGMVDTAKISVIPVETAKGLEFDAVIVIENGMTQNELYIALTRALERLTVVSMADAHIEDTEEIAEVSTSSSIDPKKPEMEIKKKEHQRKEKSTDEVAERQEPEEDPFADFDFS